MDHQGHQVVPSVPILAHDLEQQLCAIGATLVSFERALIQQQRGPTTRLGSISAAIDQVQAAIAAHELAAQE